MTTLRDAAVDPVSGDFLPPVAGISPGIHGNQGIHPVTPGVVSSDEDTQEAAESNHMVLFQKDSTIIASLDVTPATTTKAAAATQQLVATAHRTNGDSTQVVTSSTTWTTSDATKATVNAAGLVTAVATGSATITGTYRGKTDTCVVTVS